MKKLITLDYDITSKKARELREKYSVSSYNDTILSSSEDDGEILLQSEIDMCTAPDVNRFMIYGKNGYKEKINYTGWIINKKIYSREELMKMNIKLPKDGERFFLTIEGKPVEVKKDDESVVCYLERVKKKLEEQQKVLQKTSEKVNISEPKSELVLGPDLFIRVQLKTNSANVNNSTNYVKVGGKNIATNFTPREVNTYFLDEGVIRTRFFKHELTPNYDGKPHPGKEIYQDGWIYNGEAHDLDEASETGIISPSRAKDYKDSGYSRLVVVECGYKFIMNPEDMTFDEYLEKCAEREKSTKKD